MELSNIHVVAGLGFAIGIVFGAVANKTNFCTMGAISDWVNMGSKGRFGAWILAMGVAIAGTQILELTQLVDIGTSIYRSSLFGLGGYIIGGLMFGIGMTLAGGCGQRVLVRLGGGNLKSLVVVLILGLTAYMTLRGILGVARLALFEPMSIDLTSQGIEEQSVVTVLGSWLGFEVSNAIRWITAAVASMALILWALSKEDLRTDPNNLFAGIIIGCLAVFAWVVTGIIGYDDFDPVPLEALTFVAPTGNSISYLMTYTGSTINFGIAVTFGMIAGSFLYAVASRTFRIETFSHRDDMINHLVGGALMGTGGVLALGCTIGQGLSGVSTLALGSIIAVLSIMIGSAATMRMQYHRMDDRSLVSSWGAGFADILIPWRKLQ